MLVTEELAAEPEKAYSDLCRFPGVDDGFRPPDLGRVVNPYLEFRSPALRRRARRWPMPVRRAVALINNVHRRPLRCPPSCVVTWAPALHPTTPLSAIISAGI